MNVAFSPLLQICKNPNGAKTFTKSQISMMEKLLLDLRSEKSVYLSSLKKMSISAKEIIEANTKLQNGIKERRDQLQMLTNKLSKRSISFIEHDFLRETAKKRLTKYHKYFSKQTGGIALDRIGEEIDSLRKKVDELKEQEELFKKDKEEKDSVLQHILSLAKLRIELEKMNQNLNKEANRLLNALNFEELDLNPTIENRISAIRVKMEKGERVRKDLEKQNTKFDTLNGRVLKDYDFYKSLNDKLVETISIFDKLDQLFQENMNSKSDQNISTNDSNYSQLSSLLIDAEKVSTFQNLPDFHSDVPFSSILDHELKQQSEMANADSTSADSSEQVKRGSATPKGQKGKPIILRPEIAYAMNLNRSLSKNQKASSAVYVKNSNSNSSINNSKIAVAHSAVQNLDPLLQLPPFPVDDLDSLNLKTHQNNALKGTNSKSPIIKIINKKKPESIKSKTNNGTNSNKNKANSEAELNKANDDIGSNKASNDIRSNKASSEAESNKANDDNGSNKANNGADSNKANNYIGSNRNKASNGADSNKNKASIEAESSEEYDDIESNKAGNGTRSNKTNNGADPSKSKTRNGIGPNKNKLSNDAGSDKAYDDTEYDENSDHSRNRKSDSDSTYLSSNKALALAENSDLISTSENPEPKVKKIKKSVASIDSDPDGSIKKQNLDAKSKAKVDSKSAKPKNSDEKKDLYNEDFDSKQQKQKNDKPLQSSKSENKEDLADPLSQVSDVSDKKGKKRKRIRRKRSNSSIANKSKDENSSSLIDPEDKSLFEKGSASQSKPHRSKSATRRSKEDKNQNQNDSLNTSKSQDESLVKVLHNSSSYGTSSEDEKSKPRPALSKHHSNYRRKQNQKSGKSDYDSSEDNYDGKKKEPNKTKVNNLNDNDDFEGNKSLNTNEPSRTKVRSKNSDQNSQPKDEEDERNNGRRNQAKNSLTEPAKSSKPKKASNADSEYEASDDYDDQNGADKNNPNKANSKQHQQQINPKNKQNGDKSDAEMNDRKDDGDSTANDSAVDSKNPNSKKRKRKKRKHRNPAKEQEQNATQTPKSEDNNESNNRSNKSGNESRGHDKIDSKGQIQNKDSSKPHKHKISPTNDGSDVEYIDNYDSDDGDGDGVNSGKNNSKQQKSIPRSKRSQSRSNSPSKVTDPAEQNKAKSKNQNQSIEIEEEEEDLESDDNANEQGRKRNGSKNPAKRNKNSKTGEGDEYGNNDKSNANEAEIKSNPKRRRKRRSRSSNSNKNQADDESKDDTSNGQNRERSKSQTRDQDRNQNVEIEEEEEDLENADNTNERNRSKNRNKSPSKRSKNPKSGEDDEDENGIKSNKNADGSKRNSKDQKNSSKHRKSSPINDYDEYEPYDDLNDDDDGAGNRNYSKSGKKPSQRSGQKRSKNNKNEKAKPDKQSQNQSIEIEEEEEYCESDDNATENDKDGHSHHQKLKGNSRNRDRKNTTPNRHKPSSKSNNDNDNSSGAEYARNEGSDLSSSISRHSIFTHEVDDENDDDDYYSESATSSSIQGNSRRNSELGSRRTKSPQSDEEGSVFASTFTAQSGNQQPRQRPSRNVFRPQISKGSSSAATKHRRRNDGRGSEEDEVETINFSNSPIKAVASRKSNQEEKSDSDVPINRLMGEIRNKSAAGFPLHARSNQSIITEEDEEEENENKKYERNQTDLINSTDQSATSSSHPHSRKRKKHRHSRNNNGNDQISSELGQAYLNRAGLYQTETTTNIFINKETMEASDPFAGDIRTAPPLSKTKWANDLLRSAIARQLDATHLQIAISEAQYELSKINNEITDLEDDCLMLGFERRIRNHPNYKLVVPLMTLFIPPSASTKSSNRKRSISIQTRLTEKTLTANENEINKNNEFLAKESITESEKMICDAHLPMLEKALEKVMRSNDRMDASINQYEEKLGIVDDRSKGKNSKETRLRMRYERALNEAKNKFIELDDRIDKGFKELEETKSLINDQRELHQKLKERIETERRAAKPNVPQMTKSLNGYKAIEKWGNEKIKMMEMEENYLDQKISENSEMSIDKLEIRNSQYLVQINALKDKFFASYNDYLNKNSIRLRKSQKLEYIKSPQGRRFKRATSETEIEWIKKKINQISADIEIQKSKKRRIIDEVKEAAEKLVLYKLNVPPNSQIDMTIYN